MVFKGVGSHMDSAKDEYHTGILVYTNILDKGQDQDILMSGLTFTVPDSYAKNPPIEFTPESLYNWLTGSPTTSTTDVQECEDTQISQKQMTDDSAIFSFIGRQGSLDFISCCFSGIYKNRSNPDRMTRKIPICTGIPGIGKTRLLYQYNTVLDMAKVPGDRISTIISFKRMGTHWI
jgi:hypothetical protein